MTDIQTSLVDALARLQAAVAQEKLTDSAAVNIRKWLDEPRYADYAPQVLEHIQEGKWQELDDAFWAVLLFGTGGQPGRMYPIGCNAINDRTIGESAAGLATYVKRQSAEGANLSCAIAYDTRHNSRRFAELCSGIMVAAGYQVFFLDGYRSTPALSYLVRLKNCNCGIMVTASHNPPSDNAVKVYWSTGGQVLPPHDEGIIDCVMNMGQIVQVPFDKALADGKIVICNDELDPAYIREVVNQHFDGPRDLKIIYSPLHGVGGSSVVPVLKQDGFEDVEVFGPHSEPDGDFPNVPGHVSNPENAQVFEAIIERAVEVDADLILTTDPDADRMGCAARKTSSGPWATINGNQLGALLADYVLERRSRGGGLTPEHYLVTTLVTTAMVRRIGESYGVKTYDNLLVGFKWIAGQMDEAGADKFVFGTEESHGFLVGEYVRDKDGAVACMLISELAAQLKAEGITLHEKLDNLYWQHGYHGERLMNIRMEGSQGMSRMAALMQRLHEEPPKSIAGLDVTCCRDYLTQTIIHPDGSTTPLDGPQSNLVVLETSAEGNYVAVRPSGTEPKVKLYMFTYVPAEQLANLDAAKESMSERLDGFQADLQAVADVV